eukprot:3084980-Karenia_brevis.AAC.1
MAILYYLDVLCLLDKPLSAGTKLWAAFQHLYPQYRRSGNQPLARVPRAPRGWQNLAPLGFRLPSPEEAVSAIAVEMTRMGYPRMAICTLVAQDCYFCPTEVHTLTAANVVVARPRLGPEY